MFPRLYFVLKVEHHSSKRERGEGSEEELQSNKQFMDCLCLVVGYRVKHLCYICQPIYFVLGMNF